MTVKTTSFRNLFVFTKINSNRLYDEYAASTNPFEITVFVYKNKGSHLFLQNPISDYYYVDVLLKFGSEQRQQTFFDIVKRVAVDDAYVWLVDTALMFLHSLLCQAEESQNFLLPYRLFDGI